MIAERYTKRVLGTGEHTLFKNPILTDAAMR